MTQTATLETQAPKAGYAMDDVRAKIAAAADQGA